MSAKNEILRGSEGKVVPLNSKRALVTNFFTALSLLVLVGGLPSCGLETGEDSVFEGYRLMSNLTHFRAHFPQAEGEGAYYVDFFCNGEVGSSEYETCLQAVGEKEVELGLARREKCTTDSQSTQCGFPVSQHFSFATILAWISELVLPSAHADVCRWQQVCGPRRVCVPRPRFPNLPCVWQNQYVCETQPALVCAANLGCKDAYSCNTATPTTGACIWNPAGSTETRCENSTKDACFSGGNYYNVHFLPGVSCNDPTIQTFWNVVGACYQTYKDGRTDCFVGTHAACTGSPDVKKLVFEPGGKCPQVDPAPPVVIPNDPAIPPEGNQLPPQGNPLPPGDPGIPPAGVPGDDPAIPPAGIVNDDPAIPPQGIHR